MKEQNEKLLTPEENYEAARLELAVYRMMQRDHQRVMEAMSEAEANEIAQMAEEQMPRMLDFIDGQMKRIMKRTSLWQSCRRVLEIAALILLIVNLGLTVAVAASGSVRAKALQFLMEMNDSYVSVGFSEKEGTIVVPDEWRGRYYPTWIPQGYAMQLCISFAGTNRVEYGNAEGNLLTVELSDANSFVEINVENAEVDTVQIHGVEATVVRQPYGGECDVIWSLGDCYVIVSGDNDDDVLAVAQSVEAIQKIN